MCTCKDHNGTYRPVGWWQATKEIDRHSVADGKGEILSHKSWLISLWALVAIATCTGSSVRLAGQWWGIMGHERGQQGAPNLTATVVSTVPSTLELTPPGPYLQAIPGSQRFFSSNQEKS